MDLNIKTAQPKAEANFIIKFLRTILVAPFGLLSLLLLMDLAISESCYLDKLHPELHWLGGLGTDLGVLFFIIVARNAWIQSQQYQRRTDAANYCHYLKINNDSLERGVEGLWHQWMSWNAVTGFKERKHFFVLQFGARDYLIGKKELKDDQTIAEFRQFLLKKYPKV